MHSYDTVIIGGGISGLGAAYGLARRGRDVLLLEAGPQVGGALRSEFVPGGYLLDYGPNTVTSRDPRLWAEFADLGIERNRLSADRRGGRRYILLRGRPEPIPSDPRGLLATPLLSTAAKLRMLGEPLLPRAPTPDESVADFFSRRLGPEPMGRLIDPFVSGVYAGDPAQTSVRAAFPSLWEAERRAGSLLLGMLGARPAGPRQPSVLFNFRGGMAEWPAAVAAALGPERVWLGASASAICPDGPGWRVLVERQAGAAELAARQVVLAAPAHAAARMLAGLDPAAAAALSGIAYAPIALVHLGFRREQVAHPLDGFGLLCPASEGRRVLGVLWPSTLFPGRAPLGHVLTASFIGGARYPALAALPDQELVGLALEEHAAMLGASGPAALARVTRWPRAIPQYRADHARRMAALDRLESERPGLRLIGNYRGGVSVERSWRSGTSLAERSAP